MKRIFDIAASLLALCLLSPLLLAIAILVRLFLGGPVLFRQMRPGKDGRPFELVKFRTMIDKTDAEGRQLPDAERMTPFGRFLRSTSMDELPELWNVLKGEMSIVGPRPLLMEYLPLYSPVQARRHEVRPGITGWLQVNGRNSLSWPEKFALDVWYVENQSFLLDLRIILKTCVNVLLRRDIAEPGQVAMSAFRGNLPEDRDTASRVDHGPARDAAARQ